MSRLAIGRVCAKGMFLVLVSGKNPKMWISDLWTI